MPLKLVNQGEENVAYAESQHRQSSVSVHRVAVCVLFCLLPVALLSRQLYRVFASILYDETYSQIPLILVVSLYLIYAWRRVIFNRIAHAWKSGTALLLLGTICLVLAEIDAFKLIATNQNSLLMFGLVLSWIGFFLLFFGMQSFRAALFPLLFLLFMVPVPEPLLSHIIVFLQVWSSNCTAWMFQMMGVPYLRHGFEFALPGVTIRVAEECSGIRSTLALVILTVLTGQLFLKNRWNRLMLCIFIIPLSVAKNGLRIAFLSTMAIYVDPSFLTGSLHHRGGIVFFAIALIPLFLVLKFFQKREAGPTLRPSTTGQPA